LPESKDQFFKQFDLTALKIAWIFHDSTYTGSIDDERESAFTALNFLNSIDHSQSYKDTVFNIIVYEKTLKNKTAWSDLFHDIDYSILGSDSNKYIEYSRKILKEWSFANENASVENFKKARIDFLNKSLHSVIFKTARFKYLEIPAKQKYEK